MNENIKARYCLETIHFNEHSFQKIVTIFSIWFQEYKTLG